MILMTSHHIIYVDWQVLIQTDDQFEFWDETTQHYRHDKFIYSSCQLKNLKISPEKKKMNDVSQNGGISGNTWKCQVHFSADMAETLIKKVKRRFSDNL